VSPARKAKTVSGTDSRISEGLVNLGLTDYEVRVYLAILRHPGSRVPEIAELGRVPQPKVYSTLKRLIQRGLCESQLGPVNCYAAIAPHLAFRPLLEDMRARESSTKHALKRLKEEFVSSGTALNRREGRVKLFQGRYAAARNYKILLNAATERVCVVARLPLVVRDDTELVRERVKAGVEVRQIYELPSGYGDPEREILEEYLRSGANLRWLKEVPMRMVIFDDRITGLPMVDLRPAEGDGFIMIEIRNESLSRGFSSIFSMLWEQAAPIAS